MKYRSQKIQEVPGGADGTNMVLAITKLRSTSGPDERQKPEYTDNSADFYRSTYFHDEHGNMVKMPHLESMHWDFKDQLQETCRQRVNDPECTPETTYYVYDISGQRIRKITNCFAQANQSARIVKERIYLGIFEIYREFEADGKEVELERETLHLMDDKQRIALVETRTLPVTGNGENLRQLIRYQFGNHLGSASLELDNLAQIISYEEYSPYGSTTYQAIRSELETTKRYRYTEKERDDESGLFYYGARYYAPWVARWVSCDPAGNVDGPNLFQFVRSNPIIYFDADGEKTDKGLRKIENIDELIKHLKSYNENLVKRKIANIESLNERQRFRVYCRILMIEDPFEEYYKDLNKNKEKENIPVQYQHLEVQIENLAFIKWRDDILRQEQGRTLSDDIIKSEMLLQLDYAINGPPEYQILSMLAESPLSSGQYFILRTWTNDSEEIKSRLKIGLVGWQVISALASPDLIPDVQRSDRVTGESLMPARQRYLYYKLQNYKLTLMEEKTTGLKEGNIKLENLPRPPNASTVKIPPMPKGYVPSSPPHS